VFPDGWCNSSPLVSNVLLPVYLRQESNLSSRILNKLFGFKHFSLPFRVTFHRLLTLLIRYRSWRIFRFTSLCLVYSYEKTIPYYSGYPISTLQVTITRLSRSMALHSRSIHLPYRGRTGPTLHISPRFPLGIRFDHFRFRSPLLTESLLFSFPPPTKMFYFGGFPTPKGVFMDY
jgi:hypothetical protein